MDLSYGYERGDSKGTLSGKTGQLTQITDNLDPNKDRTYEFDAIGRLEKNSVYVNTTEHSYVRYEYPTNGIQSKVFATLIDTNSNGPDASDEVLSETWTDGAGRVRFSRVPHTFSGGSTATWAATVTEYDILGRVSHQSVPVEVDGSWQPAGDDYTRGWLWTFQKYDWMGRVIRKIATDGDPQQSANDSDVFISYEGCGCAGGLVTTIEGEEIKEYDGAIMIW